MKTNISKYRRRKNHKKFVWAFKWNGEFEGPICKVKEVLDEPDWKRWEKDCYCAWKMYHTSFGDHAIFDDGESAALVCNGSWIVIENGKALMYPQDDYFNQVFEIWN